MGSEVGGLGFGSPGMSLCASTDFMVAVCFAIQLPPCLLEGSHPCVVLVIVPQRRVNGNVLNGYVGIAKSLYDHFSVTVLRFFFPC